MGGIEPEGGAQLKGIKGRGQSLPSDLDKFDIA